MPAEPFLIETAGVTLRIIPDRIDPAKMTATDQALLRLFVGLNDDPSTWEASPPPVVVVAPKPTAAPKPKPPVAPRAVPASVVAPSTGGAYRCDECPRTFASWRGLNGHRSSHRKTTCPHAGCGRALLPAAYNNHVLSCRHRSEPAELTHRCGSAGCDAAFPSETARAAHRTSKHPGEFTTRKARVPAKAKPKLTVARSEPATAAPPKPTTSRPPTAALDELAAAVRATGVMPGRIGAPTRAFLREALIVPSDGLREFVESRGERAVSVVRRECGLEDDDPTVAWLASFCTQYQRANPAA